MLILSFMADPPRSHQEIEIFTHADEAFATPLSREEHLLIIDILLALGAASSPIISVLRNRDATDISMSALHDPTRDCWSFLIALSFPRRVRAETIILPLSVEQVQRLLRVSNAFSAMFSTGFSNPNSPY